MRSLILSSTRKIVVKNATGDSTKTWRRFSYTSGQKDKKIFENALKVTLKNVGATSVLIPHGTLSEAPKAY
jgi:hypothetical protein